MATRRTASSRIATDDRAVAGVVGFVLILAAALTYYSYAAQSEVPRVGAQNERAWESQIAAAMTELAQGAGGQAGTGAAVREPFPEPPEAPSQKIPLLAPLRSARASGTLSFDVECGGSSLAHSLDGTTVRDLTGAGKGCLTFKGEPAYTEGYSYRMENGGVLLVQGDRAIILAGMPLTLDETGGKYVASLTVVGLRGTAQSMGADQAGVSVGLVPRPGALEAVASNNAADAEWILTTAYPAAWDAWFDAQLEKAGFDPALNYACTSADAACLSLAANQVKVVLRGTSDVATTEDLTVSISYGRYDVSLG